MQTDVAEAVERLTRNYCVLPEQQAILIEEFRTLEGEVGGLKEALETRKVVERAKGVLMEVHGMRESEAFHRIRKTSMDARKTMKEVAEAILLAHEMESSINLGDGKVVVDEPEEV